MTDDIVARLRSGEDGLEYAAADEIERLRKNSGKTFCALLSTGQCDKIKEIEQLRSRVRLLEGYLNGALDMIEKFVACDTSDARVALHGEKKDD